MRQFLEFVAQLGLTAVFAGFIGAILGGIAALAMVALGLADSGDIYWFVGGGAGVFAVCSMVLRGRSAADDTEIDDADLHDGFPQEPPHQPLRPVDAAIQDD